MDGELVIDHDGDKHIARDLIYDVICFRGQSFATIPEMRYYLTRLRVALVRDAGPARRRQGEPG